MDGKIRVCDTKKYYDTQFQAEVAAARYFGRFGSPMMVYTCNRHFHIAHEDPAKRTGFGNFRKYRRCPFCKRLYRRKDDKLHLGGACIGKQ